MTDLDGLSWARMPATVRALARWLTIVQAVGYTTSLIFVFHTTGMTPHGAARRYRGIDPAATDTAMQFPKTFAEMLTTTHTHVLTMAVIFALSGVCLALCTTPRERMRRFLIAEPFAAILVSFSAMWLMRYVDARFAWLLVASSSIMAATFYVQAFLILRELAALRHGSVR